MKIKSAFFTILIQAYHGLKRSFRVVPNLVLYLLTYAVNKKLGFGWKVEVDHVVQHGDIDTTGLVTNGEEY